MKGSDFIAMILRQCIKISKNSPDNYKKKPNLKAIDYGCPPHQH